jgi:hypothetical protein
MRLRVVKTDSVTKNLHNTMSQKVHGVVASMLTYHKCAVLRGSSPRLFLWLGYIVKHT